jgi:F0F1-type ATP synthase assembly protein I
MNSPSKHTRRSKHAHLVGMYWATRVSSIGMQMAVPPLLGFLGDRRFGTAPWLTLLGACVGFALSMLDVLRLSRGGTRQRIGESDDNGKSPS